MRSVFILLILPLFIACSSGAGKDGRYRIGIDPTWSPIAFKELQPYVNGYTEDLLLEISRSTGLEFEKVQGSWDLLVEGMRKGSYDAVLTSLPPYTFNQAKYDFSIDFLSLGPVLITTMSGNYSGVEDFSNELLGVITGDPAVLVVEKYEEVIIRNYDSIPALLDALVNGEIEGAVLDRLPAIAYVNDLYAGQLQIASDPLTDAGLHLIVPKGKSEGLLREFNKSIKQFQRKKKLSELQKKWNLLG